MKLIIEVHKGMVSGVYYRREPGDEYKPAGLPDVFVVDTDGWLVGEPVIARMVPVEPLRNAQPITITTMQTIT